MYNGSAMLIMCVVAHNKHNWTIICNFNEVQFITPWWWVLCDSKHVEVYLMCVF